MGMAAVGQHSCHTDNDRGHEDDESDDENHETLPSCVTGSVPSQGETQTRWGLVGGSELVPPTPPAVGVPPTGVGSAATRASPVRVSGFEAISLGVGDPNARKGERMLILLGLLLVLLFFGLGFTLHILWIVAVILLLAWLVGLAIGRGEGAGRNRFYRW
jgi:hypothetical protein